MKSKEIKSIASKIWNLEQKCQKGENVSKNMALMAEMCKGMSLEDLIRLDEQMEALQLDKLKKI